MYPVDIRSNGKPVTLIPVADVHVPKWDKEKFVDYLAWAVDQSKGTLPIWVFLGDGIDMGSISDNEVQRLLRKDRKEVLDREAIEAVELLATTMKPFVKKDDGIVVPGNHGTDISTGKYRGMHTDAILAELLGFDFTGYTIAMLQVNLNKGRSKKLRTVNVHATHGRGAGSVVNKIKKENANYDNVDVFLRDHRHQLTAEAMPRRKVDGEVLDGRMAFAVACGSWDGGYKLTKSKNTSEHYSETRLYPPNWVGGGIVRIESTKSSRIRISPRTMSVCI
jgi:hypothetical protein